ncbi:MAG: ribonuclease E inhibitor RraB [Candidatus Cyclonatronum sp.]|uniref:ribonuclease E inhibitor RraB n=1 Tax=Cyclonatronum sp. TaxID=3024185 RepID=UPI0025C68EBD|nr:ribonuclease E inhibitor RraB [Cyclonatronum sp.]MCC5934760.1 ribonuclease E inhibitor RraB [Balneolales bacterium]MCH8487394.1 ribonuclease E inhibitor RraB [Cyclonatronum sp.]
MNSSQKKSVGLVKAFFRGEVKRLTQTPWPVRFFFYCDEEAKAYRLSNALQKLGHKIVSCKPVEDSDRWLVLSEEMLIFDNEVLVERLDLYEVLAFEYEVEFDGWESLMPE